MGSLSPDRTGGMLDYYEWAWVDVEALEVWAYCLRMNPTLLNRRRRLPKTFLTTVATVCEQCLVVLLRARLRRDYKMILSLAFR